MQKPDRIIAVDPDVDKSGVAELHVPSRQVNMTALTFPALVDYLSFMKEEYAGKAAEQLLVVIEAGWLNESNWHLETTRSFAAAAKIGQNTGRNHETARKIAEMSRHIGLDTIEVRPLQKCWRGRDGKITHKELGYIIGHMPQCTNQEMRDAALLAWTHAGLPLKIKA